MLQLKKSLSNHIFLMMIIIITLALLLGYFLPVGIDKKSNVSYSEYMFSAYTVLTQFGFLLFSFMIAQFFNKDYADKNIVFYRVLGMNVYQYFFSKVLVLILEAIVCIFIGLVVVSLIYGDFSELFTYFYFMTLVTIQNILIVGIISTLFSSLILSIGISIAYWIFGILVSAFSPSLSFFAPFDASNDISYNLSKLSGLNHGAINQSIYSQGAIYIVGLAIICAVILFLAQKRWVKLGISG